MLVTSTAVRGAGRVVSDLALSHWLVRVRRHPASHPAPARLRRQPVGSADRKRPRLAPPSRPWIDINPPLLAHKVHALRYTCVDRIEDQLGVSDDASLRVTSSMRDEIIERVSAWILSGRLAPGERLNERVLAELLGVSRPPVREAIRQLEGEGLVAAVPRRGSYVRTFRGSEIAELFLMRYALESTAAEIVAHSGREDDIAALKQCLSDVEHASRTEATDVIEQDLTFHREIMVRSRSARLLDAWDRLARELRLALLFVDPEFYRFAFVAETHTPLIAAIEDNDLAQVRICTRQLKRVGDSLAQRWDELEPIQLGSRLES